MQVVLELESAEASALLRFAEKSGHHEALAVLYGHLPAEVRSEQASQICSALCALEAALREAGVSAWPWIEGIMKS